MAYSEINDWTGDAHQGNPNVHYRLMMMPRANVAGVACVQDFDYLEIDARRILSPDAWPTRGEAETALAALVPALSDAHQHIAGAFAALDPDVRDRMIAALVRGDAPVSVAAMTRSGPDGAGMPCRRRTPRAQGDPHWREVPPAAMRPGVDLLHLPLTENQIDRLVAGERVVIEVDADPELNGPDDRPLVVSLSWAIGEVDPRPRREPH